MAEARPGADTPPLSVCLFCGSSNAADPDFLEAAAQFGRVLAAEDVRLVYGGGGIGLMGAAAKAAHAAGGRVLGVIPEFLRRHEAIYDAVQTEVVKTMHERKRAMFENADAFAILPGGVGTLEEVVELMSWRRLDLHRKPIVFLDIKGFWRPFFALIEHTVAEQLSPPWMPDTWASVDTVAQVLPAIRKMLTDAGEGPGFDGYAPRDGEVSSKL
jgi:uncharacterized protein (TIGR00730 family)